MDYQKSILTAFRQQYQDLTFKQMGDLTGIQSTRMFRLYNGYEMRLSEYEILEKLLRGPQHSLNRWQNMIQEILGLSSAQEARELELSLERLIYKKRLQELPETKFSHHTSAVS